MQYLSQNDQQIPIESCSLHADARYDLLSMQGTFYGQQGGQDNQGSCSYGGMSGMYGGWMNGVHNTIAMNSAQYAGGLACGTCLYYRGTGGGIGTKPVSKDWQYAIVNNV